VIGNLRAWRTGLAFNVAIDEVDPYTGCSIPCWKSPGRVSARAVRPGSAEPGGDHAVRQRSKI
jgi:hypothetical protein